jgi:cytochrome o ubiquinol oxidase subunit 3
MTAAALTEDPHRLGHGPEHAGGANRGSAPQRIIVGFGFWIFLLSDFVMFSGFFASYAVLAGATAGGPSGRELFDLRTVEVETACLLLSSLSCGLAALAVAAHRQWWAQAALCVTGLLGLAFVCLEVREFAELVARGAGPTHSAFLSAYFSLVGCHGIHVSIGLLWMGTMMAQLYFKGFTPKMERRFMCFSLFWHALDIIWIAIFTAVYLFGLAPHG